MLLARPFSLLRSAPQCTPGRPARVLACCGWSLEAVPATCNTLSTPRTPVPTTTRGSNHASVGFRFCASLLRILAVAKPTACRRMHVEDMSVFNGKHCCQHSSSAVANPTMRLHSPTSSSSGPSPPSSGEAWAEGSPWGIPLPLAAPKGARDLSPSWEPCFSPSQPSDNPSWHPIRFSRKICDAWNVTCVDSDRR